MGPWTVAVSIPVEPPTRLLAAAWKELAAADDRGGELWCANCQPSRLRAAGRQLNENGGYGTGSRKR